MFPQTPKAELPRTSCGLPRTFALSRLRVLTLISLAAGAAFAGPDDLRPVSFASLSSPPLRTFRAEFYVDNRDRDPLGIDIFDIGLRFSFQAGKNTSLFADVVADRVVSLPEPPAIPPSPRDLIFAGPARTIPSVFVGEHPYLDKRGEARADAFIPGVATIGFVRSLSRDGLATGISAALVIPMAGSLNALRSGASSGRPDSVFAALASHDLLGGRMHARVGFTLTGKGSWPDRSFSVSGSSVQVLTTHPPIGHRLDAGLAWIRPLSASTALTLESRTAREFVGPERIDVIDPVDVIFGLHQSVGRFEISAALLDHLNVLPSGASRANPLAGAIDLSNVTPLDRNAFLARVGLGAAAGQTRDGAHVVVIGVNTSTLPAGATVIAPTYGIRSEHNFGYIFTLSFRP